MREQLSSWTAYTSPGDTALSNLPSTLGLKMEKGFHDWFSAKQGCMYTAVLRDTVTLKTSVLTASLLLH